MFRLPTTQPLLHPLWERLPLVLRLVRKSLRSDQGLVTVRRSP